MNRGWTGRQLLVMVLIVGAVTWWLSPTRGVDTGVNGLPHCAHEDGGPVLPCSWNVGPGDGNGVGRAYWIDSGGAVHYLNERQ